MRIILSPTKKMREDCHSLPPRTVPALLPKAREILNYLSSLSPQALQSLWNCNDSIAKQNLQRLESMELDRNLTPAILAYDGIAFQHMAPSVFETQHFEYVQDHLRILSAFYGVLRPMDGIRAYRLEMQARAAVSGKKDLYEFWGQELYRQVRDDSGMILNLASKEYSKCIEPYLDSSDKFITCVFADHVKGKLVQKATFAKMARGEMVRYMAERHIENLDEVKNFDRMGYTFLPERSTPTEFVFERKPLELTRISLN